jgi:tRNA 2-thiouridine synthesizing protein C
MDMKSYLFLLRKPAHSGSYVQEILDVILTTAAFDQQVTLLIMDDAVFHLKAGQMQNTNGMKDIAAIYNALELYDITEIYTEEDSLLERGLKLADLCLPLKSINRNEVSAFIEGFDVVFSG